MVLNLYELSGREALLEHDDAADEGDPERGAPSGGVAEEMSQFEQRRKLRRIGAV